MTKIKLMTLFTISVSVITLGGVSAIKQADAANYNESSVILVAERDGRPSKEKMKAHREKIQERREDHRYKVGELREKREERHENIQERREDHRDKVEEFREKREERHENMQDRHEKFKDRAEEFRDKRQERIGE
ncbi:MAG: hypothetical protein VX196_00200 [Pseudomonadota bacterium]|nr:hypothetical protein [Pseudomonadota bacterium]